MSDVFFFLMLACPSDDARFRHFISFFSIRLTTIGWCKDWAKVLATNACYAWSSRI